MNKSAGVLLPDVTESTKVRSEQRPYIRRGFCGWNSREMIKGRSKQRPYGGRSRANAVLGLDQLSAFLDAEAVIVLRCAIQALCISCTGDFSPALSLGQLRPFALRSAQLLLAK